MKFIRHLKIFIAVVESGSFAKAAACLGVARPSVTKAINELEEELGARILHRTTRLTSLTSEGQLLYHRAISLLNEVSDTRNLFLETSQRPQGRLRVDIPVALAKTLIIPQLPDFQKSFPNIDIVMGVSDQPIDLIADSVDCVLRIGPIASTSMITRKLGSLNMIICASPSYLVQHGHPKTINDLKSHIAVNYFSGRSYHPVNWRLSDEAKDEISIESALMVNDAEALIAGGLAGIGLIQVPKIMVSDYIKNGQLIKILSDSSESKWPISIIYPNRKNLPQKVRVFIEFLSEIITKKQHILF